MSLPAITWDGKQISKPGLYKGIPMSAYHRGDICAGPSVSSSGLRTTFHDSPEEFWCYSALNPHRREPKEKKAWVLGRAVHHLILGEPFFAKLFVVQPDEYEDEKTGELKIWSNNANVCRRWQVDQAHRGRTVLTGLQLDQIRGMALALGRHPMVQSGILNGDIERSMFWQDAKTGLWLKSRPDAIPWHSATFADLKTTASVKWADLRRSIREFGYYQQAALIGEGCRTVLGMEMEAFAFVFVKSTPAHSVEPVEVKDNDLRIGDACNRWALDAIAHGLKTGEWPGPNGASERSVKYIEMSDRDHEYIDNKLKYGVAG